MNSLNFDSISIAELIDSRYRNGLVTTQSIENYVSVAGLFSGTDCSLLNLVTFNDEHKRAVVLFHDRGFWHEHTRGRFVFSGGSFVGEEVDSRVHLRTQLLVRVLDLYFHLDRRFRAVRLGRDLF